VEEYASIRELIASVNTSAFSGAESLELFGYLGLAINLWAL
jgi:hypothetical protein